LHRSADFQKDSYLLHDRDDKFCLSFNEIIQSGKVTPIQLPAGSPNLNCSSERWVRSVKDWFNVTSDWEGCSSSTTARLPDHPIRQA